MRLFKKIPYNRMIVGMTLAVAVLTALLFCCPGCQKQGRARVALQKDYPVQPVPFTAVQITGDFWRDRLETNRRVTIPIAFQKSEETGRIQNFEVAAGLKKGTFEGKYPFNDSDVYKIMEGAAYSLHVHPDPGLEQYLDSLIMKVTAAQEKDGYLYTARTIHPEQPVIWVEKERWSNLRLGHELYNMGHFYEAAAAHYIATGKRTLLDAAFKNADLIASVFGRGTDKKRAVPGHQEIEIGLVKLYRLSGKQAYLDLAKFFLDERGHADNRELFGEYAQDHLPVMEQAEAVGHAVRAAYMYSGLADIAALTGDASYIAAIDRIWANVVNKKLYLTGGIGASGDGEAFGKNYELPNAEAYAETCAAIANVFWNHRMFLLHGDAGYIDVLERVLYNGMLSGVSLTGDRFFYPNPLKSVGDQERSAWFGCACCPSNIARFMPSIPGYIYAVTGSRLYINLFVESSAGLEIQNKPLKIVQKTAYPWSGNIIITIEPGEPGGTAGATFDVYLRIPGWARHQPVPGDLYRYLETADAVQTAEEEPVLRVNGEAQPLQLEKGYAVISRTWKKGDSIELVLPMPVRRVLAHENVAADRGLVAFEKGPLVYCAEGIDNGESLDGLSVPDNAAFVVERGKIGDHEFQVITAEVDIEAAGRAEKKKVSPAKAKTRLVMIPYYAWAHRGKSSMAVWLQRLSH